MWIKIRLSHASFWFRTHRTWTVSSVNIHPPWLTESGSVVHLLKTLKWTFLQRRPTTQSILISKVWETSQTLVDGGCMTRIKPFRSGSVERWGLWHNICGTESSVEMTVCLSRSAFWSIIPTFSLTFRNNYLNFSPTSCCDWPAMQRNERKEGLSSLFFQSFNMSLVLYTKQVKLSDAL